MLKSIHLSVTLFLTVVFLLLIACSNELADKTFLIQNVTIVDGHKSLPYLGSLRIKDDRILEIGALSPSKSDSMVDGKGLFLAPGFIDSHSHHDWGRAPTYEGAISQGITTIIIGQDGSSKYPLGPYFDTLAAYPAPLNIGSYSGHNTIRTEVMGIEDYQRAATSEEIAEMKSLLRQELASGALGLSTGLEYDPGIYSSKEEVLELAMELKSYEARYISHMRSEDIGLEDAITEIINIGRQAQVPVQISHFKLARKGLWGKAAQMLARLDSARNEGIRITADVYPYEYWSSTMTVLFPKRDFDNIESARFAITELTTPEGMIISRFDADTSYVGKTLAEIALLRNHEPARAYLDLIALSRETPGESIIARSMTKEDIYTLIAWPHTNLCSDGAPRGHPRGWGAFPRYFHEARDIPIEDRIAKMTSAAATNLGLKDIGILQEGYFADFVLFDPGALRDQATFENATLPAEGIQQVWVSGQPIYVSGEFTGNRPGRVILNKE